MALQASKSGRLRAKQRFKRGTARRTERRIEGFSHRSRPLFGVLAMLYGYVSLAELHACLKIQAKSRVLFECRLLLGEIMYIRGSLNRAQYRVLLASQGVPNIDDKKGLRADRIGHIVVDLQLLTPEQLFECITAQKEHKKERGCHKLLSTIMLEKGFIKPHHLEKIFDHLNEKGSGRPKEQAGENGRAKAEKENLKHLHRFLHDRCLMTPEQVLSLEEAQRDILAILGRRLGIPEILYIRRIMDTRTFLDARSFLRGTADIFGSPVTKTAKPKKRIMPYWALGLGLALILLIGGTHMASRLSPDPVSYHIARLRNRELPVPARIRSATWLAGSGHPRTRGPLLEILRDRSHIHILRVTAIKALEQLNAREAIPLLKVAAKEESKLVSRAAAGALVALGDKETASACFKKIMIPLPQKEKKEK
jgi:hypothetical protein